MGGYWAVEGGAIVGRQDIPGNGGIVITDKQDYHNFEVVLEMKNDFGPDSGLFLRSNDQGQAFQAMIDYHKGGNLMGVYGEGIGGFGTRNFTFTDPKDPEAAGTHVGFIAGVIGANPAKAEELIGKMFPLPDEDQWIIVRAIAYSGLPDWKALLVKFAERMPARKVMIDKVLANKLPTLWQQSAASMWYWER